MRMSDWSSDVCSSDLGFDLKRGRGGIREIEFFAQIHQLIHGGREPALREPATLDALATLSKAGRISGDEASDLVEAYRLFRTVEHRLQMVEDKQTHTVPTDAGALDRVARLHGLDDGQALLALLEPHVARVGAAYDKLDEAADARLPRDVETLGERLRRTGLDATNAARLRVDSWHPGKAVSPPAATADPRRADSGQSGPV